METVCTSSRSPGPAAGEQDSGLAPGGQPCPQGKAGVYTPSPEVPRSLWCPAVTSPARGLVRGVPSSSSPGDLGSWVRQDSFTAPPQHPCKALDPKWHDQEAPGACLHGALGAVASTPASGLGSAPSPGCLSWAFGTVFAPFLSQGKAGHSLPSWPMAWQA